MDGMIPEIAAAIPAPLTESLALSVAEAAGALKVGENTLRREIAAGLIPSFRIGDRVLIPLDRLRQLINTQPGVTA